MKNMNSDIERDMDGAYETVGMPKKQKKRKLDIGARIVCLLIAFVIWIYMVNIHDTDTVETITLKIDVLGENALSANGDMMVYGMDKKTVVITVKGANRDLKEYSDTEYRATIDVSKISTTGPHTVDIVVKTPENSTITFVSAEPASVALIADYRVTRDIPIETEIIGADNKFVYTAECSHNVVNLSGPQGLIDRISVAVVEVGGNLSDGINKDVTTFKFYDVRHNLVDVKSDVSYSTEGITVTISEIDLGN